MRVLDALDLFLVQLDADGRSVHTRRQYDRHVRSFARWWAEHGGDGPVEDVTHEHVARFLTSPATRARRGGGQRRATTLNALRSSLRTFFGYMHRAGYTRRDPARLIRRARTASASPRALTEPEQKRLIDVLKREDGGRDYMLVALLLGAGLRIGTALALTTDDVDLEAGELVLRRMKNDRPERLPIARSLHADLRRHVGAIEDGPLFPGREGRPLTARQVNRRLCHWAARAEIASLSSHSLRHSFATRLYSETGDILVTQAALGHRSVASTVLYARTNVARLREALGA